MKYNVIAGVLSAVVTMAGSVSVMAHGEHAKGNIGYLLNDKGYTTMSNYGECWKTTDWKKALSIPHCEGDDDKDGVANPLDKCPTTPAGDTVDSVGCTVDKDSDGDGVYDKDDQCPNTPAGTAVNAQGCALDSDGDGVLDGADKCPGTPAGRTVDADGCEASTLVLDNVYFNTNSANLTPDSMVVLDNVADSLNAQNDIKYLVVVGHTDSTGAECYNQVLSESRANTVRAYLVGKGVNGDTISAEGRGESEPTASNATSAGRAKNRRVIIDIKR